jgi:hypothetical protein
MFDAVDVDGVGGLVEEHAVIADAEPLQSGEVGFESFHVALAGFRVAVESSEDAHGGLLIDSANVGPHWGKSGFSSRFNRPCGS